MNPQAIISTGLKGLGKVATTPLGRKVIANAPKILFGLGVASTVGAVGASIVGGIKAADVIDETKEQVEAIHAVPEERRDENEENKALLRVYLSTGVDLIKIFWPTILLTGLSIGCFSKGFSILNERNVALISAYNGLDKMFSKYRERVIDDQGEEKDLEYYNGATIKSLGEETIEGNYSIKHVETEALPWEEMVDDPYRIIIDSRSRIWSRNPETTLFNLKCVQEWASLKLSQQGSLFVNELRDQLDVPRTKSGAALGWVVEEDDEKRRKSNYIDFGIFNQRSTDEYDFGYRTKVDEILDGGAEPIVLNINPDGIVYDLLK